MIPRNRLSKMTWKDFLILILILAAIFDLGLLKDTKRIPEYDEMETVSGVYIGIHEYSSGSRYTERITAWDITLEDDTVLRALETIGFDAKNFARQVRYGDELIALVSEDKYGTKDIYELRWKGEVLHAYETSVQDAEEEVRRLPMFPFILLLYALIGCPVMAVKYFRKNWNRL